MRESFHKSERLCSRTLISELFMTGRSFSCGPFRAQWQITVLDTPQPVQVMISVPKSRFPKASGRNLLKRRIREAYRKNKQLLYSPLTNHGRQMILIITYQTSETLAYEQIRDKIIVLLQRLNEAVEKTSG